MSNDQIQLPLYQLDAFTSSMFGGNPAAVVPLDTWFDDRLLQAVAQENNLSETAYFVGSKGRYQLRWFTPTTEVDLCGHATLASAHVLFEELGENADELVFETRSGELRVSREADRLRMDFPAVQASAESTCPELLRRGLGCEFAELHRDEAGRNWYVTLASESEVRALSPDISALTQLGDGVVITARGEDCDFASRYFAPAFGIPEDPVTGSIHCVLVPLWAERLGKTSIFARQVSTRGGELWCELSEDRVVISGCAVLYLRGSLSIPPD